MGMKLLVEGYERLPASLLKKTDEEMIDFRRGLPLNFDEVCRALDRGDSKEVIRQAMLQQETIFQHQVLELHRLYWVQKNLVKDFYSSNGLDKSAMCDVNPLPRETEMNFLWQRRVGSSEHRLDHYMFQQDQRRNFNLQLPVDGYNKLSGYEYCRANHSNHNNIVVDLEAVDLNLSAGEENNEMGTTGRYVSRKRSYEHPQNLFDLNETIGSMSNEEGTAVSSSSIRTPMLCSEVLYESQLPALSDVTSCERTIQDTGCVLPAKLPNAGQNVVRDIQSSIQLTTTKKSLHRAPQFDFDLNMVQLEESAGTFDEPQFIPSSVSAGSSANSNGSIDESHFSTHPLSTLLREATREKADVLKADMVSIHGKGIKNLCEVLHPWNMEDSHESNKVSSGSCSDGRDGIVRNDPIGPLESRSGFEVTEKSRNGSSSMSTSTFCENYKDTNSLLELPILDTRIVHSVTGKKDFVFHSSLKNIDLLCPLPGASAAKRAEGERSEDDTLSSSTHGDHKLDKDDDSAPCEEQSSARGKSRDITRNNACSMGCQDLPEQPVLMTSDDHKIKQMDQVTDVCDAFNLHESHNNLVMAKHEVKTQKTLEMDPLVLLAAESLVDIIVKDSAKPSHSCAQVGETKLEDEVMHEQPQYSSDSLESIVLALTEVQVDECSSPTWPTEKEVVKDDTCRFKTRSGRRLRDFQKDILPGLVSLSRHEICEDLHAFTEIVKSDELSKKGLGRAFRGSWSSTVRNRRSRLYSVGRRQ